jgi:hypothetical protein
MRTTDEDDLLHVDEHQWVRREPSVAHRFLYLVVVLTAIASAIYLTV